MAPLPRAGARGMVIDLEPGGLPGTSLIKASVRLRESVRGA